MTNKIDQNRGRHVRLGDKDITFKYFTRLYSIIQLESKTTCRCVVLSKSDNQILRDA